MYQPDKIRTVSPICALDSVLLSHLGHKIESIAHGSFEYTDSIPNGCEGSSLQPDTPAESSRGDEHLSIKNHLRDERLRVGTGASCVQRRTTSFIMLPVVARHSVSSLLAAQPSVGY